MRLITALLALLSLWIGGLTPSHAAAASGAAESAARITVATRILPPMVVENGGKLSGFSIDLWDEIAARLGLQFEYKVNPDVRALLQSLRNNEAQVGIAAISIWVTPRQLRDDNGFAWGAIAEVAKLFAAIFVTMAPVLAILRAGTAGAAAPLVALTSGAGGEPIPWV